MPTGVSFSMRFRMNVILEDAGKIRKIRAFKDILATCFNLGAVLRGDWKGSCSGAFREGQLSPEVPAAGAPAAPRPDACRLPRRGSPLAVPVSPAGLPHFSAPATAPPLAWSRQPPRLVPGHVLRLGGALDPSPSRGWAGSQPAQGSGPASEKEPGEPPRPHPGSIQAWPRSLKPRSLSLSVHHRPASQSLGGAVTTGHSMVL